MRASRGGWPPALAPVLLALAAAAAYGNALSGPFVFDDGGAIVENRHIRQLWPLSTSMSAPAQASVAGRPLVSLSLALNYAAGGLEVRGYHLVNVAIHLVCAWLFYAVVRRTLRGPALGGRFSESSNGIAFSSALIWLVHPLCTETVNYVVQRTESIMAAFYLLTLYAAIRSGESRASRAWIVLAVAACTAGMLSKESMVTAPVAVLLYDLAYRSGNVRKVLKERLVLYTGLAATWIVLGAILWSGPRSETVGFSAGISVADYAKHQCVVILDYLRTAFWPDPLVFDYGQATVFPAGTVAPYAALLAALLAAVVLATVRRPVAGFPALWIFLVLAPTSSFVPIASEVGAERRMYLPLAGLAVLSVVAGFLATLRLRGRWRKPCAAFLVLLTAATLGWSTVRRNLDYRTAEALWRSAVEARPDNPRAHNNLGQAIHTAGRVEQAIPYYLQTLKLDDSYSLAHFNLGVASADLGQADAAAEHYRTALQIDPALERAHHNLGSILANRGELEPAIRHYREALRLRPDWAGAQHNLGRALRLSGRAGQALEPLREAVRLDPACPECLSDLAWILATHPEAGVRRPQEAVRLAQRAASLTDRRHATTLDTLAAAYASAGRYEEAAETAREAHTRSIAAGALEMIEPIAGRLELYLRREPYREP